MITMAGPAVAGTLSPWQDEDLRLAVLIRHFERTLLELFEQGLLHGTTHTCLGQEYVPVALRALLGAADYVFSNHRGHGHYLARHEDVDGLLAELMGRRGAVCAGVGGSQHLLRDRYLSTGVQGQSLPVAVGAALSLKRTEPGAVACTYIGDGTWGEGAVYEALNMAALWRVPLVVVVEHNGIAQSTPTAAQMAGTVARRAAAFGIAHHRTESCDVNDIRNQLRPRFERVRASCEPLVVEFATHRLGPHSKGDDSRPPELVAQADRHDWYRCYSQAYPDQTARWDAEVGALVAQAVDEVLSRPPSEWSEQ